MLHSELLNHLPVSLRDKAGDGVYRLLQAAYGSPALPGGTAGHQAVAKFFEEHTDVLVEMGQLVEAMLADERAMRDNLQTMAQDKRAMEQAAETFNEALKREREANAELAQKYAELNAVATRWEHEKRVSQEETERLKALLAAADRVGHALGHGLHGLRRMIEAEAALSMMDGMCENELPHGVAHLLGRR